LRAGTKLEVSLSVFGDEVFLPLCTSFAEKAARAFGLAEAEALALTLAAEEIFVHLCKTTAWGGAVDVRCRSGVYYVEQDFSFKADDFDMEAFNLTAKPSFQDERAVEETGLLIASRMVDRFTLSESEKGLRLTLIKHKAYPEIGEVSLPPAVPLVEFLIRSPDPEELKIFSRLVSTQYAAHVVPEAFHFPGKLVDMVLSGDAEAAIAVDAAGHVGGGLFWQWKSDVAVECSGPYLFDQPEGSTMAQALVDACIAALGRTSAVGLFVPYPTPELPRDYFEVLGHSRVNKSDGTHADVTAYYRHLQEDLGDVVWVHPSLEPFLRHEYQRLAFVREMRPVKESGETSPAFSVLSTDFDRHVNAVTLRPVRLGHDSQEIIAAHVQMPFREQVPRILFEIDLGIPWHSHFVPGLLANGFHPCLVFPYAGKKDLVVFEYSRPEPLP